MKVKLSIVIACYNDPDIVRAVEAANKQTYKNKEIIIVDDGSEKNVGRKIQALRNEVDLILVQKNKGQSAARNYGIENAKGRYILNWDSDDFFDPEFCEKAILKLEQDEDIKIVTCKARRFTKKNELDIFTPSGGCIQRFLFKNGALGSSMFRKEDWKECGGYEENLPILGFEDWEFYIQLLKRGGEAYVIPEILFHYQIREGSTTSRIQHLKQEKFRYIILKHKDLYMDNFEELISNLFFRINKAEIEVFKRETSINYKTGKQLLAPFRYLKTFLNK